jgi:hypothetical protein
MITLRRAVAGHVTKFLSTVGERQIRVIASDATPDRMGDILEPGGCQLDDFRRKPIMLAQHDSNQPIGSFDPCLWGSCRSHMSHCAAAVSGSRNGTLSNCLL